MGLRTVILLPVTFLVAGRIAPFRAGAMWPNARRWC